MKATLKGTTVIIHSAIPTAYCKDEKHNTIHRMVDNEGYEYHDLMALANELSKEYHERRYRVMKAWNERKQNNISK